MDKIKKSELLELRTKLIKDIRGWKPSNNDAPDCFTMLHKYDEQIKCSMHFIRSGASDFEEDLGKLINDYVKAGLKKPDLVKKMEWMTDNCKFS